MIQESEEKKCGMTGPDGMKLPCILPEGHKGIHKDAFDVSVEEQATRDLERWKAFTDRELHDVINALAHSPTGGSMRCHRMIDEIAIEAAHRGSERAGNILS